MCEPGGRNLLGSDASGLNAQPLHAGRTHSESESADALLMDADGMGSQGSHREVARSLSGGMVSMSLAVPTRPRPPLQQPSSYGSDGSRSANRMSAVVEDD